MKISFRITPALLLTAAVSFIGCGPQADSAAAGDMPESPDAAIQYVAGELAKGNGTVLWQAMPASYQQDVNAIARLAGTKLDAEIYDHTFATLARAAAVLDQQQNFVFESKLAGGPSAEGGSAAQIRTAWPSLKKIIDTLTASPLATAGGMQSFDGAAFFETTVSALLADMDALAKLDPERGDSFLTSLSQMTVNYVEGTGDQALLELAVPGQEVESESFLKVEDRWVPQELAEGWAAQIAETRSKLEAINPEQLAEQKPRILNVFTMIDGVLTQIEAAETQAQFDQALQGAIMPLMGLMMMGQGMGSGSAAPAMPVTPAMPQAPVAP